MCLGVELELKYRKNACEMHRRTIPMKCLKVSLMPSSIQAEGTNISALIFCDYKP